MLTGKKICIVGGDLRQIEMIRFLSELDAMIYVIGFENYAFDFVDVTPMKLQFDSFRTFDAVILPVSGLQENGEVETLFSSQSIVVKQQHIQNMKKGAFLYTGIQSNVLNTWCEQNDVTCIELLLRDDVAIYNSIPTVEGAIMIAIQQTDITIHGSTCFILGFGRVGSTLANVLKQLGAHVHVGVRKSSQYARAYEKSLNPFYMNELDDLIGRADLVFNTVPARVLDAHAIAQMQKSAFILDLASKPGGTDFRFADRRGIKSMLALGLPGKVAAKTAGRILAKVINEHIQANTKGGC